MTKRAFFNLVLVFSLWVFLSSCAKMLQNLECQDARKTGGYVPSYCYSEDDYYEGTSTYYKDDFTGATVSNDAAEHLNSGHDALKKKDYAEAKKEFTKSIEIDPSYTAYIDRAETYLEMKDYHKAMRDYESAIKMSPGTPFAYLGRGFTECMLGDLDAALADEQKVKKMKSDLLDSAGGMDFEACLIMSGAYMPSKTSSPTTSAYDSGLAHLDKQEYDAAIADFNKVLKSDPKNINAYFNRGMAYYGKQIYKSAIADFTKAIALEPKAENAFFYRGLCYELTGKYDAAISDFNSTIGIDPKYSDAYYNRGRALHYKQMYGPAIADYNKTLELEPNGVNAIFNRGIAYYSLKKYGDALADFNQVLKLDPNNAGGYFYKAICLESKGNADEALKLYNKFLQQSGPGEEEWVKYARERIKALKE